MSHLSGAPLCAPHRRCTCRPPTRDSTPNLSCTHTPPVQTHFLQYHYTANQLQLSHDLYVHLSLFFIESFFLTRRGCNTSRDPSHAAAQTSSDRKICFSGVIGKPFNTRALLTWQPDVQGRFVTCRRPVVANGKFLSGSRSPAAGQEWVRPPVTPEKLEENQPLNDRTIKADRDNGFDCFMNINTAYFSLSIVKLDLQAP